MDKIDDFFWRKPTEYRSFHDIRYCGYVDVACCIVIVISNSFLILVFTRKNMTSPINTIFIHMAISESLESITYLPRAWHEHIRVRLCHITEHRTYIWEMISVNSYRLAFTFRQLGVWFALMLAVWRYIAIIHPFKERHWCNMKMTRRWIIVGYFITALYSIPPYLAVGFGSAVKFIDQNGCPTSQCCMNVTVYEFQVPLENYPILYRFLLFLYGFFIKLVPSVVMGVISFKLIMGLTEIKEHRKGMVITSNRRNTYDCKMTRQIRKQTDRVTKILIIILMSFVIGETPHGIFALITIYFGPKFFWKYYYYAMEIFNMMTLISQSFNFVIYYLMCNQFRNTFKTIFSRDNSKEMIIKTLTPTPSSTSTTTTTTTTTKPTTTSEPFVYANDCFESSYL